MEFIILPLICIIVIIILAIYYETKDDNLVENPLIEFAESINENHKVGVVTKARNAKYIMLLQNRVPLPICSKCYNEKFMFVGLNDTMNGFEIQCTSCGKKQWHKIENNLLDEVKQIADINFNVDTSQAKSIDIMDYFEGNYPKLEVEETTYLYHNSLPQIRSNKRHSISKAVRQEVWQRDSGKCVECGSNEKLEYDHIIPVSKGGANTCRNIQLLCENCNRKKSAKIM